MKNQNHQTALSIAFQQAAVEGKGLQLANAAQTLVGRGEFLLALAKEVHLAAEAHAQAEEVIRGAREAARVAEAASQKAANLLADCPDPNTMGQEFTGTIAEVSGLLAKTHPQTDQPKEKSETKPVDPVLAELHRRLDAVFASREDLSVLAIEEIGSLLAQASPDAAPAPLVN